MLAACHSNGVCGSHVYLLSRVQFWETLKSHPEVGLIHNEESASVTLTASAAAAFWGEGLPVRAPSVPAPPAPPVADVFDDMD